MDPRAIEIPSCNGKTRCVSFKPNSYCLVGTDEPGDLRQCTVDDGDPEAGCSWEVRAKGNVYVAVASMDGRWIVGADLTTSKVTVWNAVTLGIAVEVSGHGGYVNTVDVSSDSTRVASGSEDSTVRIFDIVSGARVIPSLQHDAAVVAVKFSPDGGRVATATRTRATVGIYNAHSGEKLLHVPIQITPERTAPLAWSSDSHTLFIATSGRITSVDTFTSLRSQWPIQNGDNKVSVITYGRFIVCSAGSSVSFWDYVSRKQIGSIINHATPLNCISISHDGRYLACGHDRGITAHDLSNFLPSTYLHVPRMSRLPLMQLSDSALESWTLGNSSDTERILSEEIEQHSDFSCHALAARSLIRAHSREWQTAMEDADRSLRIKRSPIGQIARSLALVGVGEWEAALEDIDLVFRDCDPGDNLFLLVIKSIFVFICGRHKQAVSRIRSLLISADEKERGYYFQVLGNMYLKQRDYENAVQTLEVAEDPTTLQDSNCLLTISLVFNWNFNDLKVAAWQRLCEFLYTSGRIKEVGETLLKMVGPLAKDEKETVHGRVLEEIVTRSGEVTLLAWTGKSSACNSCLPSSPAVYGRDRFIAPRLEHGELGRRTNELQAIFPPVDALLIYGRFTRTQPVRFARFRLLLPCIVFGVTKLKKGNGNVYRAETARLGDVEFATADSLPLQKPRRLVFVNAWTHGFNYPRDVANDEEDGFTSDAELDPFMRNNRGDTGTKLTSASTTEVVPSTTSDTYTRALELIARLGQPFTALLLLRQSDGTYKRVAADCEIVVRGIGNDVPRNIHVEVLEIL